MDALCLTIRGRAAITPRPARQRELAVVSPVGKGLRVTQHSLPDIRIAHWCWTRRRWQQGLSAAARERLEIKMRRRKR
ncbi:hypothetical protein E2C01_037138 [Portunus trituberculatus]|uniref:Uncharacterized protein n=1 Tax=Portunus trituberculatus TaxID=210409 RepID=A0A5B7FEJ3_PORTR|nr:hypothetical protein [Portunus trituberculatus]